MTKIVLNQCPKGPLLSEAGWEEYRRRTGYEELTPIKIARDDPVLVAMMEEDRGKRIWAGACSHVSVVEMPDGIGWRLMDEGKFEWISAVGDGE